MVKAHSPINWQNYPSIATPINEANLNKIDSTIGILDDRIIELDNKANGLNLEIQNNKQAISDLDNNKLNQSTFEAFNEANNRNLNAMGTNILENSQKIDLLEDEVSNLPTVKTTTETTITDSADAPVIYLKEGGYTEQDGTPTLDAPIHVDGLGDMGYFDSKLLQGYYAVSDGSFKSDTKGVCCKNKIPCKNGDLINISYEENIHEIIVLFYDANDNYLSNVTTTDGSKVSTNAPNDTAYFYFDIYDNTVGVTLSTAKHISVTINGKYAVRVKTVGKNLFDIDTTNFTLIDNGIKNITQGGSAGTAKLKAGKTYSITLLLKSKPANDTTVICYINNAVNDDISFVAIQNFSLNVKNTKAYTPTEDCTLSYSMLGNSGASTIEFQLQVEEGTNATPYEPYTETTVNIPIDSPLYDGDYIECFADGSGKIVHNWNTKNVTRWESFMDELTTSKEGRISTPNDCKKSGKLYCTIAKQKGGTTWGDDRIGIIDYGGTNNSNICVRIPVSATITDYPCNILYELATPTETPLTAEQVAEFKKLRTFDSVTHINADGTTTVRYYCNTDSGCTVGMLQEMVEDLDEVEVANSVYATTGSGGGGETKKKYTFNVGSNQDPTTKILTGSGDGSVFALTNPSELNVGGAEKDGNGNIIADTYLTGFTQLGLVNASGGVASSTLDIDISEYKAIALSLLSYYNVNIWGSILAPKSLINDGSMYPTTIRCTCYGPDDVLLKATYNANTKVLSLDPGTCSYSLMAYLHGLK